MAKSLAAVGSGCVLMSRGVICRGGIKCAGAGFLAEGIRVESGSEPMHLKLLLQRYSS